MAKFQPILGNIAGSIGGNVFSNNRGGTYVKRRSIPTNPNSSYQQVVRAYLSTLTKAWQFLTPEQRAAWDAWADSRKQPNTLGNEVNYTGHQMFISTNMRRLQLSLPTQTVPPANDTPPSLSAFGVILEDANTVSVIFTPTPLGADRYLQLWQCVPYPGNRNPNFAQARLVGYSVANPTSPTSFTLKFPLLSAYSCVFYGCVVSATGLQSPPLRFKIENAP